MFLLAMQNRYQLLSLLSFCLSWTLFDLVAFETDLVARFRPGSSHFHRIGDRPTAVQIAALSGVLQAELRTREKDPVESVDAPRTCEFGPKSKISRGSQENFFMQTTCGKE